MFGKIMSYTKRLLEKQEEERHRKEVALLEVPSQVAETHGAVEVLTDQLEKNAVKIAQLEKQLVEANCFKSKMRDYLIGGMIGAILGALASMVIK